MSTWRNDFATRKENIPPAARGNTECHGTAWILPCQWISGRWVGYNVSRVGRLGSGECFWDLRAFPLVALPAKREK